MSTEKGFALITGASSGIGAVYADRLAKRGYDLILVARSEDKLNAVAKAIRNSEHRTVLTVQADLTVKDDLRRVEALLQNEANISVLVNNAGFGGVTHLLQSNVDEMERMIALNVTALTRLTYAAAPSFVARGTGTIINISSIVAVAPEILNGVYGATKGFVLTLTHSLQHELAEKGVRIQAVLPGATATEFWSLAGLPVENLPSAIVMSASEMVDAALAGLDKGEVVTIPSLHEGGKWDEYEAHRLELSALFGNSTSAPRYAA